jgi:ABC-type phosphate transport system substrate-binding protein
MKRILIITMFVFSALFTATGASFAELAIVGNPDIEVDSITPQQIKQLYLGRIATVNMTKIELVDCSSLQAEFLEKFVEKTLKAYNKIWIKKIFAEGATPPLILKDENEVVEYVKKTKNAIAYLQNPPAGVKVLYK